MGRKSLVWYPGVIYHITIRGNHRNEIFKDSVWLMVLGTVNILGI